VVEERKRRAGFLRAPLENPKSERDPKAEIRKGKLLRSLGGVRADKMVKTGETRFII